MSLVLPGLGRVYKPDARDRAFGMTERALTIMTGTHPAFIPQVRKQPWHLGQLMDQNGFDECVIYSFEESLEAAPKVFDMPWTVSDRHGVYDLARQRDGIPMPHAGTTARAICSLAKERELLDSYWWITNTDTMIEWLKGYGTLLQGTDWFPSMFETNKYGYVEPTGQNTEQLGHEYLCRWYYPPSHPRWPDSFEYRNTWGAWGYQNSGRFFMKRDAVEYLLWQLNGDLVLPIQKASLIKSV